MIYKFQDGCTGNVLEVEQHPDAKHLVTLCIDNNETEESYNYLSLDLNEEELYDLIGALHSIQAKIKKEVKNG